MKALNSKYLKPPRSGMIVKDTIYLRPGHFYYRFAHSMIGATPQPRERIIGGAWWLDADAFRTIRHRATRTDSSLSATARRDLAMARQWGGRLDIVVKALVKGPLVAFVGVGTIQAFDPSDPQEQPVWMPSRDIAQLYVPGLQERNPATGNRLFTDAFHHAEQTRIGWDVR